MADEFDCNAMATEILPLLRSATPRDALSLLISALRTARSGGALDAARQSGAMIDKHLDRMRDVFRATP